MNDLRRSKPGAAMSVRDPTVKGGGAFKPSTVKADVRMHGLEVIKPEMAIIFTVLGVLFESRLPKRSLAADIDRLPVAANLTCRFVTGSGHLEELAAREIICMDCSQAMPDKTIQDNAPYIWGGGTPSVNQMLENLYAWTDGALATGVQHSARWDLPGRRDRAPTPPRRQSPHRGCLRSS